MNFSITVLEQWLSTFPLMLWQSPLAIALCASVTVLVAFAGVLLTLNSVTTKRDIQRRTEGKWQESIEEELISRPALGGRFIGFLTILGQSAKPRNVEELSRTRQSLIKAGYRKADASIVFFGMKLFLLVLFPILYIAFRPFSTYFMSTTQNLTMIVFLALVGCYLPNLWVRMHIRTRQRQIFEGFPDALDLMVVCVEAGLGLDAALQRAGQEMRLSNKILSEEFLLFGLEMRAGQTRQRALQNLSQRIDMDEINSFAALMIQTEKFGTSIAQALRVHAEAMRVRRRQKAEELAQKIPVKLIFPLVFFILPSLIVVVVGPAVIKIIRVLLPILQQ